MAQDVTGGAFDDIAIIYKSKQFTKTVSGNSDGRKVGYTFDEMLKQEGIDYFNYLFDKMKKEAKENGLNAKIHKQDVWDSIKNEVLQKTIVETADISDMWDGISKGKCRPHYGHGKEYWNHVPVGIEGFAGMYSASVMNPESISEIKHYFPKSYKIFEEILKEFG